MALGLSPQIGLITHLFSLLVPALGAQCAALTMGLATTSAIAGRTLVGWVMPTDADRRVVASASYAVQITGSIMFILAAGRVFRCSSRGVLFGVRIGNATSLRRSLLNSNSAKTTCSEWLPWPLLSRKPPMPSRQRPLVWSGNSPRTQQAQPRPRLRACLSLPRLLKDWQLAHFCWVETDYARFLSRRSGRQGHGGLGREQ